MSTKIIVTEETRLVTEHYLRKQHARIEKRKAKKELKQLQENKKEEIKRKPIKLANPYKEHIAALEKLETLILGRRTSNGQAIAVDEDDEKRIEAAGRYVETAIELLKTLKKMPI